MARLFIALLVSVICYVAPSHAACTPLTTIESIIHTGGTPVGEDVSEERKVRIYEKWAEYKLCMAYTRANPSFCIKSDTSFPTQPCERFVGLLKRSAALADDNWTERLQLTDECAKRSLDGDLAKLCVALISRDVRKCALLTNQPYRSWCPTFVGELGVLSYTAEQWLTKGVVPEEDKDLCDRSGLQSKFSNWVMRGQTVDEDIWDVLAFDNGTFSICDGRIYHRFRFHSRFLEQLQSQSDANARKAYAAYDAWKNPPTKTEEAETVVTSTGPDWKTFLNASAFPTTCPAKSHNETMYWICTALKASESQAASKCEQLRSSSDPEEKWGKQFCLAAATGDGTACAEASRWGSSFASRFGVSTSNQRRACEAWNKRDRS